MPQTLRVRGLLSGGEFAERPRATFNPPALDRLIPVVLQHWKLLLISALIGLCAAIAALPLMQPRYLITAKVLVQLGREMTAPPSATAKEVAPQIVASKRPEDLGSEIEIMKSPQLLEQVVNAFGVDFFLGDPPAVTLWQQAKQLVRNSIRYARETVSQVLIMLGVRHPVGPVDRIVVALQQAFSMEDVRKSDVISVQLRMPSPEVGIAVMRKYLELFQELHIAAHRAPRNREFFQTEASRSLAQLAETQARLARFKDENKAWSIAEQSALLLKTQRELADAHGRTQREMVELENRIAELRRQEALLPPTTQLSRVTAYDPVSDDMRKQRAQVEAQMAQTAVVFGDRSPQMIQLRRQLDSLNAGIGGRQTTRGDQETTGINQHLFDIRRELASSQTQMTGLQARVAAEKTQLTQLEDDIRRLAATETTLLDLQREIGRLDREYQLYTSRLEDSRISEAMDMAKISNVHVISAPTANPIPVFPPLLMVLAGGVIIGLGGSLAFVFLRDTMRPVVRNRRDVEQLLGVPVLASLPEHRGLR